MIKIKEIQNSPQQKSSIVYQDCHQSIQKHGLIERLKHLIKEKEIVNEFQSNKILINLDNYILQEKFESLPYSETYKIINKTTNDIFLAKVNNVSLDVNIFDLANNISKSMKNILKLNHPCLLKYIGYSSFDFKNNPNLTIITEYAIKNNLYNFLHQDISNSIKYFNDTLKLISIYGIASSLSFLHENNIVHPNLTSLNVNFDSFLLPKISNYLNLMIPSDNKKQKQEKQVNESSKICEDPDKIQKNSQNESKKEISPYIAPETSEKFELTKESNVYSFGIIVHEIILNEKEQIPQSYSKLIDKCLLKESKKRPTFDEILTQLRNDRDFITEKVNEKDFKDFVRYIDESKNKIDANIDQYVNFQSETFLYKKENDAKKQDEDQNEIKFESNQFININRFELRKCIGKGGFAKVFQVKEISTGKIFAAKTMLKSISSDYVNNDYALNLFREIKLMSALNHLAIIKFFGYSPIDFYGAHHPTMIIEFGINGSLRDIINKELSGR